MFYRGNRLGFCPWIVGGRTILLLPTFFSRGISPHSLCLLEKECFDDKRLLDLMCEVPRLCFLSVLYLFCWASDSECRMELFSSYHGDGSCSLFSSVNLQCFIFIDVLYFCIASLLFYIVNSTWNTKRAFIFQRLCISLSRNF